MAEQHSVTIFIMSSHSGLQLSIPHSYDPHLKKITIRGASSFPRALFDIADDVEILDMSFGNLSELPSDFDRMHRLKTIFLSYNDFKEVPEVLSKCLNLTMLGLKSCKISHVSSTSLPPNLRALILTDNQITSLPSSIGNIKDLQKLTLTGNRLSQLPREILSCQNLELIRIAANNFSTLPEWLLQLPRLAWYCDAGNPGSMQPFAINNQLATVSWNDITLRHKIGESPKNIVYEAMHNATKEKIAVKLYGNDITADGYSSDEVLTNILAATHANIISATGKLVDTPDGQLGLAMQLIPKEFNALAGPPDFTTLTRDIYPDRQTFSLSFIVATLTGVSAALQHLHAKGIMHGDIYAHNILVNNLGFPYIGDFGAASLYNPTQNHSREYIEVRAFTHLMGELLSRCAPQEAPHDQEMLSGLRLLQQSLLQATTLSFAHVGRAIQQELL